MIGLLVPPDRWTCPTCGRTEVPDVPVDELAAAIRAAQEAHAADHPAPWVEPTRARHPVRRKADAANKARRTRGHAARVARTREIAGGLR